MEYVTSIRQMLELGITATPALVIDGDVKCVGRALDLPALKELLTVSLEEAK